ncbi:MAG: hypothetical protein NTZ20_05260 [Candidatus Levybacteria bacterium]|nr:hypothetical protein [Candidatus Levybacteria bacterium]
MSEQIPWYLMSRYVGTVSMYGLNDDDDEGIYYVRNFIPDENYLTIPNSDECMVNTDTGTLTGFDESGNVIYTEDIINLLKDIPITVN